MMNECPKQVRTYDFMFDALSNGRRLKIMTLEGEFTREDLAIKVDKSIKTSTVKIGEVSKPSVEHGFCDGPN